MCGGAGGGGRCVRIFGAVCSFPTRGGKPFGTKGTGNLELRHRVDGVGDSQSS